MKVLENTTINEELIVTSQMTLTGEIIVNSNIIVKESGHLIIKGATLYFDKDCGLTSHGVLEAISSTFDAKGLNWESLTIEGENASDSILKNCTIKNAAKRIKIIAASNTVVDSCIISDFNGGGIMCYAKDTTKRITVRNCTISDCSADKSSPRGGGIFARGDVYIEKCTIRNCKAENDGGGVCLWEGASIAKSTVEHCETRECGGGIYVSHNGKISNCTINDCTAVWKGGGILCKGNILIESSTVFKCSAEEEGGGISAGRGNTKLSNVEIIECDAEKGGGMHIDCSSDVQSITPTKIIKCRSSANHSNAIMLTPSDGSLKADNFLLIDCIKDLDSKDEYLLNVNSGGHGGYSELSKIKAYSTLENGLKKIYGIENYINVGFNSSIYIDTVSFPLVLKFQELAPENIKFENLTSMMKAWLQERYDDIIDSGKYGRKEEEIAVKETIVKFIKMDKI